jgi:hypothetical protein
MAICQWCGQEMRERVGCTVAVFDHFEDGIVRDRIRWPATESRWCGDCDCPPGSFHHPGCDMEICPDCGLQALSCGCPVEEDEEAGG